VHRKLLIRSGLLLYGVGSGAIWGFALSIAYILVLSMLAGLPDEPSGLAEYLPQLLLTFLFLAFFGALYGILPATILGALTGAILGGVLALLPNAPSRRTTTLLAYGVAIALLLLASFALWAMTGNIDGFGFFVGVPGIIYLVAVYPWSNGLHKNLLHRLPQIPSDPAEAGSLQLHGLDVDGRRTP